jgi:hypothetical protein
VAFLFAAMTLAVYLATTGGSLATSDALMMFDVTKSLVQHGSLSASGNVLGWEHNRGIDGRFYSQFGIGQSIYNVPFYIAGARLEAVAGRRIGRPDTVAKAAVAAGSAVAAALSVWIGLLLAYALTRSVPGAIYAAAALAFGTLLWPYAKFGFNQPLATCCMLAATYAVWRGVSTGREPWFAAGGLGLAAGLLTRHEFVLATIPVGLTLALASGGNARLLARRFLAVGLPFGLGLMLWTGYNQARFGSPFNTGYAPTFGNPLQGAWGLLFSPGASLFLYSPIVIAGVAALVGMVRRNKLAGGLFVALALIFLSFYSSLSDWQGGRSYGPRYLVPLLPFFCIPLAYWFANGTRRVRAVLIAGLAFSVLAQAPGVLVDFSKVGEVHATTTGESHTRRTSSWHSASLVLNARAAIAAVPINVTSLIEGSPPGAVQPAGGLDDRSFSRQFAFSFDLWWLYLFHMRVVSAPVAVCLGIMPWLVAVTLGFALRRALLKCGPPQVPAGSA